MRTNILPSELHVGQRVAISRYSGYGSVSTQGVYVVAKANKIKVVLKRESDGYERSWSVKRNTELPRIKGGYAENNTFIESIETMEARKVKAQEEARIHGLWKDLEQAAIRKNVFAAETILAQLKGV